MRSIYTFDIGRRLTTRAGIFRDDHLIVTGVEPTRIRPNTPRAIPALSPNSLATYSHKLRPTMTGPTGYHCHHRYSGNQNGHQAHRPRRSQDFVLSSPNIAGLNNIAFMDFLSSLGWDVPIHIENDANAALRSITQHPTALSINMGTGIGGAVKRNNRIRHFGNSWSCYEIGHGLRSMYPDELMLRCSCGGFGCI